MSLAEIKKLVCQQIGIDTNIIGERKLLQAIENRCHNWGIDSENISNYWQMLRTSTQELEQLLELIVIPETWFFRDQQPFNFLNNYLQEEWLKKPYTNKLRLLSVPCSTGEEPYSLAMTLLDGGILPTQFEIDAVDISKKSLEKAKKAIYNSNSFRGTKLDFQSRYFTYLGKEYQLCEKVKNTVNFMQGNLLDPKLLMDKQPYHIIFCRNVLIYFDSIARNRTLTTLHRLLKKQGWLLVSASETGELTNYGFELVRFPFGFIGQKKDLDHNLARENMLNKNITNTTSATINYQSQKPRSVITVPRIESINTKNNLEMIRKLANEGNLKEAASQCQNYLIGNGTNAEAHLLMGEIYQAQNLEIQAEKCFEKAIYLDAKNSQALLHLILLKEKQGDINKAKILQQRWQRLQNL